MTPTTVTQEKPKRPVCPACGSTEVSYVEEYSRTGVYAPDGGEEYRTETGCRCWTCGAVEDEPDWVPEEDADPEPLAGFAAPVWLVALVAALVLACLIAGVCALVAVPDEFWS